MAVLLLFSLNLAYADSKNPWADVTAPLRGKDQRTEAIGTYASGCLRNGIEVPISNPLWELVNTQRHRNYAHPRLISFLIHLGAWAYRQHLGKIVVGDIAMPAGGPLPYGHASHQMGLDVDIRFSFADSRARMDDRRREGYPEVDVAAFKIVKGRGAPTLKKEIVRDAWTAAYGEMLAAAASYKDVERIFVSPPIKQELCEQFKPATAAPYPDWLRKIEPYFGHTAHFHVRLACPADSPMCIPQRPVGVSADDPTRVGCAGPRLQYWLDGQPRGGNLMEQRTARRKKKASPKVAKKTKPRPAPPAASSDEPLILGDTPVPKDTPTDLNEPVPALPITPPPSTPVTPALPKTPLRRPKRITRSDFLPEACKELIRSEGPNKPL